MTSSTPAHDRAHDEEARTIVHTDRSRPGGRTVSETRTEEQRRESIAAWIRMKGRRYAQNPLVVVAVLAETVVRMGRDPQLRAMAVANSVDRFEEGCRAPWFDTLFARTLIDVQAEGVSDRVVAVILTPEGGKS